MNYLKEVLYYIRFTCGLKRGYVRICEINGEERIKVITPTIVSILGLFLRMFVAVAGTYYILSNYYDPNYKMMFWVLLPPPILLAVFDLLSDILGMYMAFELIHIETSES